MKLAGVFVLKSVHMWTAKTLVSWMGATHQVTEEEQDRLTELMSDDGSHL